MTEPPAPPPELPAGVIPYVEAHTGPRRILALDLEHGWSPVVGVDGRSYRVLAGRVLFEIPADRAVHLSVHVELERPGFVASTVIGPGTEPLVYAYAAGRVVSGAGRLTRTG